MEDSPNNSYFTGCSLNIVFFPKIFEYSGLWSFSVLPWCRQCVYTHQAGRTPALQQNWQSSEKSQNYKEKKQYLMKTLFVYFDLDNEVICGDVGGVAEDEGVAVVE